MGKVKYTHTSIESKLSYAWLQHRSLLAQQKRYVNPEADKWLCATAVLDIALKRGEFTNEYLDTIPLWQRPGLYELTKEAEALKGKSIEETAQETVRLLGLTPEQEAEARERGQALIENNEAMPHNWDEAIDKFPIVLDFMAELLKVKPVLGSDLAEIIGKISYFVKYAFNRQLDTENDTLKITAESSPTLFRVIVFNSYCTYLGKTLADFDTERGILPIEALPRAKRDERLAFYQALRLKLHNDQTYLTGADYWYQCRVNPGSITIAAENISRSQKRNFATVKRELRRQIQKYDIATDYPIKE
jgi:hypothetical protein